MRVLPPLLALLVVAGGLYWGYRGAAPEDTEALAPKTSVETRTMAPPADMLEKSKAQRKRPDDRADGFQEAAVESGITFRMNFLPGEQGEKFKTNLYDHGCGVAIGDFDGDGYDDIYFVNQLGANALYKNRGDGTFIDVTEQAGVGLGDRICTAATWADYDNSGQQSLFVTSTRGGNVLFKNLGDGKFKDVTKEAGLTYVGHCQTAVFFDYDNDGYLDLLVLNTAKWTGVELDPGGRYHPGSSELWDLAGAEIEHSILYHNNRDGTFTDVTAKAGWSGTGWASDAAVLDYDEDGYLDVLVGNMFGRAHLFHNNGNGTFTDVAAKVLGKTSWGAAGCKAFDFNNDGRLDLLIVDMHSDMWLVPDAPRELIRKVDEKAKYRTVTGIRNDPKFERDFIDHFRIHSDEVLFGNTFFKNQGNGKFEEMSDKAGLETWWPWGIGAGDFDNDGYEDLFLASGMGYPFFYWPNHLLMNNGNETFSERAVEYGIEPPRDGIFLQEKIGQIPPTRSSRSCAVADFDGDGRLDIVTNNFNDRACYFRNQFPQKNFIAFRLQGTKSNRDAIGAVVRLHSGRDIMTRQVNPNGGYLAQSSKTLHFGLGARTQIDRVEIRWPSGRRQILTDREINRRHDVVEPAS
jgi:hypothetical protein